MDRKDNIIPKVLEDFEKALDEGLNPISAARKAAIKHNTIREFPEEEWSYFCPSDVLSVAIDVGIVKEFTYDSVSMDY